MVYDDLDLSQIFPIKSSEFEISLSVESYDEETTQNCRNGYVDEKRIASKISEISIPNLIAQIEDFYQDCVKISRPYH